jgi:DnaK suppressor protein
MQKDDIKQNLLKEISKTEEKILKLRELTKPIAPDCAIGRVSRMDAIINKSVNEQTLQKTEEKLQNLNRVYSQIGTDDFGICLKCRQPIPLGRILIRPESLYCVRCAR